MSEALAHEAARFGVRLSIVEPGGYWTQLYHRMQTTDPRDAYEPLRAELHQQWSSQESPAVDSAPELAAQAVMKLVNSANPPVRLVLGSAVLDAALANAQDRIQTWTQWEEVSRDAEHAID